MKYWNRNFDRAINVAIVLAALLLCAILIQRYYLTESGASAGEQQAAQLAQAGNNMATNAPPSAPESQAKEIRNVGNEPSKSTWSTTAPKNFIGEDARRVSEEEFKRATASGQKLIVIDVRERPEFARGHLDGAINIPADELEVRAINELSPTDFFLIYCGCFEDSLSQVARNILNEQGFRRLAILWDSKSTKPCPNCQ